MELQEQALHFCKHIETLTKAHCTMLDLPAASFCIPPFRCNCALKNGECDAYQTHLYGSYEAERWDGKYIYYCPRGLVFIATSLRQAGKATEYCLITGPFIMSNSDEDVFEDDMRDPDPLDGVPRLTTAQARALNEMTRAICGYLTGAPAAPDVDSGRQAGILQMMYDLAEQPTQASYPLESERQLQQQIRAGDKEASQNLLNELLCQLYFVSGTNLEIFKTRVRELITLMSRAAIDGGADKEASQNLLNELLCQLYFVSGTNLEIFKTRVRELITLMSRAAIDGGADVNEVFSLCYHCEKEVANFHDFESLNIWLGATLHKFISFVFDFTEIKHQNVIRKTSSYIKEHLAEKLTLEQAAEQVYLSKSYFCRILKDELGCTFTEYVNRLRIERSKTYLRETAMPIAEIACAVGFDDQSYFTRIFKRHVGTSPGKYRDMRN